MQEVENTFNLNAYDKTKEVACEFGLKECDRTWTFSGQSQRYSKTKEKCEQKVRGEEFVVYTKNGLSSNIENAIKYYTLEFYS